LSINSLFPKAFAIVNFDIRRFPVKVQLMFTKIVMFLNVKCKWLECVCVSSSVFRLW